jgi:hypothetical protein
MRVNPALLPDCSPCYLCVKFSIYSLKSCIEIPRQFARHSLRVAGIRSHLLYDAISQFSRSILLLKTAISQAIDSLPVRGFALPVVVFLFPQNSIA